VVRQTSDFRIPARERVDGDDELIEELANYVAAAYLAHQLDISFETALHGYVATHGQIGGLWTTAARFILWSHMDPPGDSSPFGSGDMLPAQLGGTAHGRPS